MRLPVNTPAHHRCPIFMYNVALRQSGASYTHCNYFVFPILVSTAETKNRRERKLEHFFREAYSAAFNKHKKSQVSIFWEAFLAL